jgi:hypothetical protein
LNYYTWYLALWLKIEIRERERERNDVGKYSFVNRTIKSWNQLPENLLEFFPCKLNTFKRVKNVVTSKGI